MEDLASASDGYMLYEMQRALNLPCDPKTSTKQNDSYHYETKVFVRDTKRLSREFLDQLNVGPRDVFWDQAKFDNEFKRFGKASLGALGSGNGTGKTVVVLMKNFIVFRTLDDNNVMAVGSVMRAIDSDVVVANGTSGSAAEGGIGDMKSSIGARRVTTRDSRITTLTVDGKSLRESGLSDAIKIELMPNVGKFGTKATILVDGEQESELRPFGGPLYRGAEISHQQSRENDSSLVTTRAVLWGKWLLTKKS